MNDYCDSYYKKGKEFSSLFSIATITLFFGVIENTLIANQSLVVSIIVVDKLDVIAIQDNHDSTKYIFVEE
jgi:hypothetical protein